MVKIITLLAGQVSEIESIAPGTRITSSGNGSIEWVAGSLSDAKNSATWTAWAKGSSAGYMDAVRQLCIRATATGSMTVTIEESKNDFVADDAYWDSEYARVIDGALMGPDSRKLIIHASLSTSFRSSKDNNPRITAVGTTSVVAFGGTPTAGELGYANSGISVTGLTLFDLTDNNSDVSPFRITGGIQHLAAPVQGASYYIGGVTRVQSAWTLSVVTDAPELVLSGVGNSSTWSVVVDGKRYGDIVHNASPGFQLLSLNLRGLDTGFHTVELLLNMDERIRYLYIPKSSMAFAPPDKPVIAMITDSLGNTSPTATQNDCFSMVAGDFLGADVRVFAAGATGYITPDTKETFINRIPLAATSLTTAGVSPDLIVLAGGVNDTDSAGFQAAVEATIIAAQERWNAPVCVLGSWATNVAATQAQKIALEAKLSAAATAAGASFVPVMTDPTGAWITGTGNVSAPAGDGTSDVLFNSGDITHWNTAGHAMIGRRVAYALADVLGL